jgi:hypothetical protein
MTLIKFAAISNVALLATICFLIWATGSCWWILLIVLFHTAK